MIIYLNNTESSTASQYLKNAEISQPKIEPFVQNKNQTQVDLEYLEQLEQQEAQAKAIHGLALEGKEELSENEQTKLQEFQDTIAEIEKLITDELTRLEEEDLADGKKDGYLFNRKQFLEENSISDLDRIMFEQVQIIKSYKTLVSKAENNLKIKASDMKNQTTVISLVEDILHSKNDLSLLNTPEIQKKFLEMIQALDGLLEPITWDTSIKNFGIKTYIKNWSKLDKTLKLIDIPILENDWYANMVKDKEWFANLVNENSQRMVSGSGTFDASKDAYGTTLTALDFLEFGDTVRFNHKKLNGSRNNILIPTPKGGYWSDPASQSYGMQLLNTLYKSKPIFEKKKVSEIMEMINDMTDTYDSSKPDERVLITGFKYFEKIKKFLSNINTTKLTAPIGKVRSLGDNNKAIKNTAVKLLTDIGPDAMDNQFMVAFRVDGNLTEHNNILVQRFETFSTPKKQIQTTTIKYRQEDITKPINAIKTSNTLEITFATDRGFNFIQDLEFQAGIRTDIKPGQNITHWNDYFSNYQKSETDTGTVLPSNSKCNLILMDRENYISKNPIKLEDLVVKTDTFKKSQQFIIFENVKFLGWKPSTSFSRTGGSSEVKLQAVFIYQKQYYLKIQPED